MNEILTGAIVMCALVVALFFLRFWRSTRDRFFLYFAIAFSIEGVSRILFGSSAGPVDTLQHHIFYLLRLVAYGLILLAIWEKNRPQRKDK